MGYIQIIEGDILEWNGQYLAHQCNCVSRGENVGGGLYASLVKKYPHADVYAECDPERVSKRGSIVVRCGLRGENKIISMFAQTYPGKPLQPDDTKEMRLIWFKECLKHISKIRDLTQIAFPWGIGCGLAQGEWKDYSALIQEFSDRNPHIDVCIVKLPPQVRQS